MQPNISVGELKDEKKANKLTLPNHILHSDTGNIQFLNEFQHSSAGVIIRLQVYIGLQPDLLYGKGKQKSNLTHQLFGQAL